MHDQYFHLSSSTLTECKDIVILFHEHEIAKLLKKRKQYLAENLTNAIQIVIEWYGSVSHASYVNDVPWQTIRDRIDRKHTKESLIQCPCCRSVKGI